MSLEPNKIPLADPVLDDDKIHISRTWLNYFTAWANQIIAGVVQSITGTSGRILVTGTAVNPVINIDPAYVGQTSITTLGAVTTGNWSATPIAADKGGTGQTSYLLGDTLFASGPSTLSKLPGIIPTSRHFLSQTGNGATSAAPSWTRPVTELSGIPGRLIRGTETGDIASLDRQIILQDGDDFVAAISAIGTVEPANMTICGALSAASTVTITPNIFVTLLAGISVPSGVVLTINCGMLVHPGGYVRPASGGTVALGSNCLIYSAADWRDTSLGGIFTVSAGSWERRSLTRVTAPTGGLVVNEGSPENDLDESSGVCFVRGGTQTFPHSLGSASELSIIGGGYDNHIGDNCAASNISGGAHHTVSDNSGHSFIGGGAYQVSYAGYAVLCGGTLNNNYSTFGFMGAGHENTLGDPLVTPIDQRASVLVGGYQNSLKGIRATLVGGYQNILDAAYGFIGGGRGHSLTGENGVIPGGQGNTVSAKNAGVSHGQGNVSSSLAAISGGEDCQATENYAVAVGENLRATAAYSVASGSRAAAYLFGQKAHASGYFSTRADAQISDLVARVQTTGSQTKDLDLFGGITYPIVMPNNATWNFKIQLVARNKTTNTENGAWNFEGAIVRNSNAASTAIVGTSIMKTTINKPAGWSANVTADTTNGGIKITVAASIGTSDVINWVARIQLVETAG